MEELSADKQKLMEKYESKEYDKAEEIRKLRKEAAELRVNLSEVGKKNDELYQTCSKVNKEFESLNRDYYQAKSQQQEGQKEVSNIQYNIENLNSKILAEQKEKQKRNEEKEKLQQTEKSLIDELENQKSFQLDLKEKLKDTMSTLESQEKIVDKITREGIDPNIEQIK